MHATRQLASLTVLLAAAVSCGPVAEVDTPRDASSGLATGKRQHLLAGHKPYVAPKAMMLQVPVEQAKVSGGVQSRAEAERLSGWQPYFTKGGAPLPVYLERAQITYQGGADNSSQNVSSVVGGGSATVGRYQGSDASWNQIVSCVQSQFAAFNLEVTDVEPPSGEYVEAHFGGTPGQVGLPNGVGGVAPIDNFSCNIIPRAVVYIFSDVLGNSAQLNCEVAAQEIAHAFSLDHEFLCQDPMTYLSGCGAKTFQDQAVNCGEFEPRQCNCGRASQDSVQIMLDKLGASGPVTPPDPNDTVPPTAQLTSPANATTLQGNQQIQVVGTANDNGTVASIDLLWNFNGEIFPCPTQQPSVTCTRTGNTATWTINVGLGDRTFSMRVKDNGNNTTTTAERTIHLTADGQPGTGGTPDDAVAPVVSMVSPQDGAELLANSQITVSAQATDDQGLAAVELLWTFSGDVFGCPLNDPNVTCVQTGNTFTWKLNVGVGARQFQVRATDLAGNTALTPEVNITLTTDPAPPDDPPSGDTDVAEPNDDAASAFSTRCGTAIDVVASPGNDDWFTVEAPEGTDVQVGVAAAAGSSLGLALFATDGTTALASNDDAVGDDITVTSAGPNVLAKVTSGQATAVSYRLAVTCGNGETPPPPGSDDDLEPNNDPEGASRSFCGQERDDLAALDDDFFVLNVRANDTLHVTLRGDGASAQIVGADGTVLSDGGNDISAEGLAAGDVYVHIAPAGGGSTYDVAFDCASGSPQLAAGGAGCHCGASESNDAVVVIAAFAGVVLLRRRRRRA